LSNSTDIDPSHQPINYKLHYKIILTITYGFVFVESFFISFKNLIFPLNTFYEHLIDFSIPASLSIYFILLCIITDTFKTLELYPYGNRSTPRFCIDFLMAPFYYVILFNTNPYELNYSQIFYYIPIIIGLATISGLFRYILETRKTTVIVKEGIKDRKGNVSIRIKSIRISGEKKEVIFTFILFIIFFLIGFFHYIYLNYLESDNSQMVADSKTNPQKINTNIMTTLTGISSIIIWRCIRNELLRKILSF
jgi:hypothetical protein